MATSRRFTESLDGQEIIEIYLCIAAALHWRQRCWMGRILWLFIEHGYSNLFDIQWAWNTVKFFIGSDLRRQSKEPPYLLDIIPFNTCLLNRLANRKSGSANIFGVLNSQMRRNMLASFFAAVILALCLKPRQLCQTSQSTISFSDKKGI